MPPTEVIYDGAGFHHRDGHSELPANVRVIPLPAYSRELNPVERLWDQVREALANELHANLETLEQALTRALRPFWEDASRACSLIGKGWLLTQANVTGMGALPV